MEKYVAHDSPVAIVTGAYDGIGGATAKRLGESGQTVICCDHKGADATVSAIRAAGGTSRGHNIDVSNMDEWNAVVEDTISQFGRIDGLVNVAATGNFKTPDTILGLEEEGWTRVMDVNLKGPWFGMRAVLPHMLQAGHGNIVNFSSLAATRGLAGNASYAASKGGIEALTRQAAVEYGGQGILVNAVSPGRINTPWTNGSPTSYATLTTLGRHGEAVEVASLVNYLLTENTYLTGQVLSVDGGWSTHAHAPNNPGKRSDRIPYPELREVPAQSPD
jgi:NAD(P)-dependent dehydrogenase (short-subunit alcohol dehydrogenase family)